MTVNEDCRSWGALALRLRPFIARRVASAADADDVLQEVLLRLHRGLSGLGDEERFVPWMYRVTRNALADYQKARARHPLADGEPPDEACVPTDEGEEVSRQVAQYLSFFVALLSSPYREAVTLTELEGRTQREAAQMVGISLSGMKSRVQRGRERVREMLEACCEIALDARGRVVGCEPRPSSQISSGCCEPGCALPEGEVVAGKCPHSGDR